MSPLHRPYLEEKTAKEPSRLWALLVRAGRSFIWFVWLGICAVILCQASWFTDEPAAALLPVCYLVPHFSTWRHIVRLKRGKGLNKALGDTARNMFLFALLLSIGLIL